MCGDHDFGVGSSLLLTGKPAPKALVPTQRFEPTGFDLGEREFGVGGDHGDFLLTKDEGRPFWGSPFYGRPLSRVASEWGGCSNRLWFH